MKQKGKQKVNLNADKSNFTVFHSPALRFNFLCMLFSSRDIFMDFIAASSVHAFICAVVFAGNSFETCAVEYEASFSDYHRPQFMQPVEPRIRSPM